MRTACSRGCGRKLPAHLTLAACRHGALTELGNAGATEAEGKKLGVGKRMAELLREGKDTNGVLETIRAEFPDSRAGRSDVSIIRSKIKRGLA